MRIFRIAMLLAAVSAALAGCAVPQRFELAAQPLDPPPVLASPQDTLAPKKSTLPAAAQVHLLVEESQNKCSNFVNALFTGNATDSLLLDVLGTGTSALATVFTATPVTHSLSAASTLFGATKTSISANFLNTLAISHIVESIQSTYNSDMDGYLKYLATLDPNKIDYYGERARIHFIHGECSLAAAEASLTGEIAPPAASSSGTPTYTYDVPSAGMTADKVARDFISRFNIQTAFKAAGATASLGGTGVVAFSTTPPLNLVATAKGTITLNTTAMPSSFTINASPAPVKGDTIAITVSTTSSGAKSP